MTTDRAWKKIPETYRRRELKIIADWALNGVSGSVVGLPGIGKSNLLGFLSHRPEILQSLLASHDIKVGLVPIDLNNLPDDTIATFYRVILRAFYENQTHFDSTLQALIEEIYQRNKASRDPFLVQSALRELLIQFREQRIRILFVFDRFEDFEAATTPQIANALRGLRDSFKDMLFYIVGMRQEVAYLSNTSVLGELYEILDTNVCWVWPMNRNDSELLISQETSSHTTQPTESDIELFIKLSGGFPSLLKTICSWWKMNADKYQPNQWGVLLLSDLTVKFRLQEILDGLSQEELLTLTELEIIYGRKKRRSTTQKLDQRDQILDRLTTKGICKIVNNEWYTASDLLAAFIANVKSQSKGRIWLDEETEEAYQDKTPIQTLTPLERGVLHFLLRHPRIRHTKSDLIINAWPDDINTEGVTDDSLYQVIGGLRRKIEPNPTKPSYLLNWRGTPEGGYQFFPEGKPR